MLKTVFFSVVVACHPVDLCKFVNVPTWSKTAPESSLNSTMWECWFTAKMLALPNGYVVDYGLCDYLPK